MHIEHYLQRVLSWHRNTKRLFVAVLDVAMGIFAMWLAFTLRLETLHWPDGKQWIPYLLAPTIAFPILVRFGLYRAIFRYTGIRALVTTGQAVILYGCTLFAILLLGRWEGVPRSLGVLQPVIFLVLVGASRSLGWLLLAGQVGQAPHRLLIYGAGTTGAQTAAGLGSARDYELLAFVDDDPAKVGRSINGVRVYGPHGLPETVKQLGITDVLLALPPHASRSRRKQIIERLQSLPVRIRTLPGLTDLASGKVTVTDFQDLDIEDLLGREPVAPHLELLKKNIQDKVVMVTGAGGSIGSELCRQIVTQKPSLLILLDHSEFALYSILQELENLRAKGLHTSSLAPVLANVRDEIRLIDVCKKYKPNTIYHAAAYKHVPIVEKNPSEGVLTNVFGTLNVLKAANLAGTQDFVLISTDKAVRPTNVMGATKRAAEIVLQAINASPKISTRLSIVRFGNVLGSSGSVIPLFRRQIATGGPITVTHPEITRYFMTIPEAAQLVLQASAMAEGGDVFLLDMGEPIRIVDLAKRMIKLSGLKPQDQNQLSGDIEISFTGLRPGEKLHEELLVNNRRIETQHPRIFRAQEEYTPWSELKNLLTPLKESALQNNNQETIRLLKKIVTDYQFENNEPKQNNKNTARQVTIQSTASTG